MMNQNGKLLIKGKIYNAKESDFTNLGEIGAGTCGQVFKKCFNPAGEIMAVKVTFVIETLECLDIVHICIVSYYIYSQLFRAKLLETSYCLV